MIPSLIFKNFVEAIERRRLFDLGHDAGAARDQLSRFGHIIGALHEGERDPVDADVGRSFEVGTVLLGQRRDRE